MTDSSQQASNPSSWRELFYAFAKIGILSFGGPAAQISLMHRLLVEEKTWLSDKQFLSALNFCMLLPGPEAMQLATYAGWKLRGVLGGLLAGLLFVVPGAVVILCLAYIYAVFGNVPLLAAIFLGVKAAVLVIVIEALLRVAKRALHSTAHWLIAGLAFVGIFFLSLPYPLIVLAAGLYGFLFTKASTEEVPEMHTATTTLPFKKTAVTAATWLAIWLIPVIAIYALGDSDILGNLGVFFSKLAIVTFGGAYAVLAYMTQDVVNHFAWLSTGEMMDGLGLAETTPGPLILVTEFVGFLASYKEGGLGMGIAGAAVTLWATFAPCFLWIFVAAPYVEWISAQPKLNGALSAITAAVVGVIVNLSLWFGLHVLFTKVSHLQYGALTLWMPDASTIDWRVVLLIAVSAVLLFALHWGIARVLAVAAFIGWLVTTLSSS